MRQSVFAIVVACSLLSVLTSAVIGAQKPSGPLSSSSCSTSDLANIVAVYNFDSPTRKAAALMPSGVKSYLAQLLVGRLHACASLGGSATAACAPTPHESDPFALWRQLKFCENVFAPDPPENQRLLLTAAEPTLYVLLSVGAGPGGSPGGSSKSGGGGGGGFGASGGRGGSGPATGSTSTGSSVDNPAYFLLFLVAQRFERDVCTRSNISVHDCDAQHPVAVVPESTWNLEDFRAQCFDDPYVPNDPSNPYGSLGQQRPTGRGTLGAIVLNGSTVTADGTFAIFTVYGSSEANYTAQAVDCRSGSLPSLASVWSGNISNGNKTTALSFFPIALAGTLLSSNSAAHQAVAPAPNSSASPNALNSFITYQNDIALGTFAANSAGLALGNPSSGLTFRHTFEAWANSLANNMNAFCKLEPTQNLCRALKLPSSQ